ALRLPHDGLRLTGGRPNQPTGRHDDNGNEISTEGFFESHVDLPFSICDSSCIVIALPPDELKEVVETPPPRHRKCTELFGEFVEPMASPFDSDCVHREGRHRAPPHST